MDLKTLKFRKWFKYRLKDQKFQKQHALKGQKLLAQGSALGIMAISKAPCKGKSFVNCLVLKAFALTGRQVCVHKHPGRCPGLRASALSGRAASMSFCPLPLLYPSASDFQFRYAPVTVGSGRVGLTCETCIYKISYQILFGFILEYVLVRKKFFLWKKYQSIIFWQNVEISCWYIIRYKNDTFSFILQEVS